MAIRMYLSFKDDKFKLFVDVTSVDEINNGDRLPIVQDNSSSDATNGQVCCI